MMDCVKMNRPVLLLLGFTYFLSAFTTTRSEAHLVDGIFTEPTLETGYHLIATIPIGATNLNVSELRRTNNYLAVRLRDGRYLLNGNFSINRSGIYKIAGTNLVYRRQTRQHSESLTAVGPLLEPIDVMLLYQEPNSGIVYRYHAPAGRAGPRIGKNNLRMMVADEAPSPPAAPGPPLVRRYRNKRKFTWRPSETSACSKTCGGGVETRTFICVREHTQIQVPIKRCHGLEKPSVAQVRCNTGPCPPKWRMGSWSECSVTCGVGVRTRRDFECVQEINNMLTVRVSDGACLTETKSPIYNETCVMPPCEDETSHIQHFKPTNDVAPMWDVGEWTPCSTSCGRGKRSRSVICITSDRFCSALEKPVDHEICDTGIVCSVDNLTLEARNSNSRWLYTEWSEQCSADCGTGIETRSVVCVSDEPNDYNAMKSNERQMQGLDNRCSEEMRPESTRSCYSNRTCGGQWFTGPWTQCSVSCDSGEQTREVTCVAALHGKFTMLTDMNCPEAIKPDTRRPCKKRPCHSIWYTSSWSQCTRSCGTGSQSREVKCLNPNGQPSNQVLQLCNDTERPESRRICNDHPCTVELRDREGSTRSKYVEQSAQTRNGISGNEDCKDSMANCALVTQARLCIYPFYQTVCCASCLKSRHEEME